MELLTNKIIQFDLPKDLACPKPTEDRGLSRDAVRLLVTEGEGTTVAHHDHFYNLEQYLQAGDVLVVNTSATVPSAFPLTLPNGNKGMLHLSNKMNAENWLVEIRAIVQDQTERWKGGEEGLTFDLEGGGRLQLKKRFYKNRQKLDLWIAHLETTSTETEYLQKYGQPIKYTQLNQPFPMAYYQTFFSHDAGSAEMPSAGRAFTGALVRKLARKGVVFAPVLLHTGISSLEEKEEPYPEYMEVNPLSALLINQAKSEGRRVIAVGTTAIRAIESAANQQGIVEAYRGDTELYIQEGDKMKVIDGLITGFHEPHASHLNMLQALAGYKHIENAYQIALDSNYYWHQFGDLHLILKRDSSCNNID